jgi:hypothetical protein
MYPSQVIEKRSALMAEMTEEDVVDVTPRKAVRAKNKTVVRRENKTVRFVDELQDSAMAEMTEEDVVDVTPRKAVRAKNSTVVHREEKTIRFVDEPQDSPVSAVNIGSVKPHIFGGSSPTLFGCHAQASEIDEDVIGEFLFRSSATPSFASHE